MYCLAHILIVRIKLGVPLQLRGLENKEVEGKVRAVEIIYTRLITMRSKPEYVEADLL